MSNDKDALTLHAHTMRASAHRVRGSALTRVALEPTRRRVPAASPPARLHRWLLCAVRAPHRRGRWRLSRSPHNRGRSSRSQAHPRRLPRSSAPSRTRHARSPRGRPRVAGARSVSVSADKQRSTRCTNLKPAPRSHGARLRRRARLSSRSVAHEPRALRAIANCRVTPAGPTLPSEPIRRPSTKMRSGRGSDPRLPTRRAPGRRDVESHRFEREPARDAEGCDATRSGE